MYSLGFCAQVACIWETTAACPGNAHRYRDFSDTEYVDFLLSAAAIAPALDRAQSQSVGTTVLQAVQATRLVVTSNTNLGILLLLAPLAAVPASQGLRQGVVKVLDHLDLQDALLVFKAIRLANPAGLGDVPDQDVKEEPTRPLREIMGLAADRDLIARQYVNGCEEVFNEGLPALQGALQKVGSLEEAIIYCHLYLMAHYPDSLIARKRGLAEAEEASRRAAQVLKNGWPGSQEALVQFDGWLRSADRGRNPGTTSDLVTACLFVALREGIIRLPTGFQQSAGSHP